MRVKICGITQPDQGRAIANLGTTTLGFICVSGSPRYVTPEQIAAIAISLPETIERIGVFVNESLDQIVHTVHRGQLTGIQLHGQESPQECQRLRQALPQIELIKAIRVKTSADLKQSLSYVDFVDTLLMDAYHPQQFGGTGITLDWQSLQEFTPPCPWFLAGGLTPDNVTVALRLVQPDGIDLSSGVERTPGDKDLGKVQQLFNAIRSMG